MVRQDPIKPGSIEAALVPRVAERPDRRRYAKDVQLAIEDLEESRIGAGDEVVVFVVRVEEVPQRRRDAVFDRVSRRRTARTRELQPARRDAS